MVSAADAAVLVVQLMKEQLFELLTEKGLPPRLHGVWVVHVAQGVVAIHEVVFLHYMWRERFGQRNGQLLQQGIGESGYASGREPFCFGLLGCAIDG